MEQTYKVREDNTQLECLAFGSEVQATAQRLFAFFGIQEPLNSMYVEDLADIYEACENKGKLGLQMYDDFCKLQRTPGWSHCVWKQVDTKKNGLRWRAIVFVRA